MFINMYSMRLVEKMQIMLEARSGKITPEMEEISKNERISLSKVRRRIASGKIIVIRNLKHKDKGLKTVAIGKGLSTKVNVNIGTSTNVVDLDLELRKLRVAMEYGADTVMDLSTGGDLDKIRNILLKEAKIPLGTVPIYQAYIEGVKKKGSPLNLDEDDFLRVIEKHLRDGVDFMTIHAGIRLEHVKKMKDTKRVAGIVSRGGSILAAWMLHNNRENPLYTNWDYILEMFAQYDAIISIGDALRPGSILDSHDYFQMAEMVTVADLVDRAWRVGVQVMVEGPGHVPLNEIAANVRLEKKICKGAPYYVLGPLPTDIAAGYDHIASAVGASIASAVGADLICYLTPAEHLGLPNVEQVKEGLIASKIAAHIGDIIKLGERAYKKDYEMSVARRSLNWEKMFSLVYDPDKAKGIRDQFGEVKQQSCTMCGSLCVYLVLREKLGE